jgi:ribosomal protein S18 acetylase RimI-like enzyme
MKQIETLDELYDIVSASFKKGTITNNYMLLDAYETYIKQDKLLVVADDVNTAILLDKGDFYQLYFYLNDVNVPLQISVDKPLVMEILYRGLAKKPDQAITYWENLGFIQHLSRDNMVASSNKIVLPETQSDKLNIRLASNELEVKFTKNLFDDALDKYTGDRLSYGELNALMKNKNLLCAYYEAELAGVLQFEIKNKVVWLGHIAVHPDFQGKGVANALVYQYVTMNNPEDNTRYALWVIQDNAPAIHLYRKFGFVYGNKSTISLLKLA